MKKLLIGQLLLVLLLPLMASGQLNKGSCLSSISSGFAFNHEDYESASGDHYKSNVLNFQIGSNIGLFVADRIAIGSGISCSVQYSQNSDEYADVTFKSHSTIYSISLNPFARYYFATQGKLAFFVQAEGAIGYGQNLYTNQGTGASSDKTTINILMYGGGAGIGLVYFLKENIGLETQLSYEYIGKNIIIKDNKPESENNIIGITLGISYYIGKSKEK